jgi:hypothetical protein
VAQPSGFVTRWVEAGYRSNASAGLTGRACNSPPQFGHRLPNVVSTQSRQNVHSNVQIIALRASGGRSLSQHSQFGLISSMRQISPESSAVLSAITQKVIGENDRHHRFAHGYRADAHAGIMTALGDDVGLVAVPVDRLTR